MIYHEDTLIYNPILFFELCYNDCKVPEVLSGTYSLEFFLPLIYEN